ncbi:hypothetical protein CC85DRAFT_330360 [Cutaneotrichosporon oleaginosum]|uniref:Uncharacterized protein n=1 Tax=Cutaneotrichosporon oleaginosum TaxID=879819 RepID=A0A0J1AX69_9TREE|nr:uncharacterized protein CC85DRAFT_330360 [Cutaneotrichosporon oleaginosum]KLT39889.1 hypothetical protein CC85DRAFT_330360 [Cutaneotrichosporon oleaginosum]TXT14211.1 hypothetical protein COLE_00404 [Cutaneotrichosporon oleaginosum]
MSGDVQMASPEPPTALKAWAPPHELPRQQMLPDRLTTSTDIAHALGKESDPTRMGIFLCLIDERPHLHPSLQALHAHRARAHGRPAPDPTREPSGQRLEWTAWKLSPEEEARRAAWLPHP